MQLPPRGRQTGMARMNKVVWGVLSTAKIGRDRVLPGMKKSGLLEIRAIAEMPMTPTGKISKAELYAVKKALRIALAIPE